MEVAVLLMFTVACRTTSTPERHAGPDASSSATASEIEAVSCGSDVTCKLVAVVPERADALETRRVAIVEHDCDSSASDGAVSAPACAAWLLEGGPGRIRRSQLLSDRCSPQGGVPSISFPEPGRIREIQTDTVSDAGSPATWTISDIALNPPRLARETGVWMEDGHGGEGVWDFETARGRRCELPSPNGPCQLQDLAIPVLTVEDPSFATDGWKNVSLGDCGVYVDDATKEDVFGRADAAAGAHVQLLVTDSATYVEVWDDAFVVKGKVVDRLLFDAMEDGAFPGTEVGWELNMDGRARGIGRRTPKVEMVSPAPSLRRFKITNEVVDKRGNIDIIYHDTADGVVERSYLSAGQEPGWLRRVPPEMAFCTPEDGTLRVHRRLPPPAPTEPIIR